MAEGPNGGKDSQPSIPSPKVVEMEAEVGETLEERMDVLQGMLGRAIVRVESLGRFLDRQDNQITELHKEVISMKQILKVVEARVAEIPAIKELLVEALTAR
jgi:hypothetical protein